MVKKVESTLTLENANLYIRNFSGNETKYNPAGRRNFCVFIDDLELADQLSKDGWNVKERPPRNEEEAPRPYLQVAVSYDNIPPKIVQVTSKNQTILDESTVGSLDWAEITNVDMIIRPYNWEVNGKTGVKAYLKSMYVTIEEDELAAKYEQQRLPVDDASPEDIPF